MARLLFTARDFGSLADPVLNENIERLSKLVAKPIQVMTQEHGNQVSVIERPISAPVADAMVSCSKEIALAVRVADCLPLLLYSNNVIAAVHVGRKGLMNQVAVNAVTQMRKLGAKEITGVVGPHICGLCYEVGADIFTEVTNAYPATFKKQNYLDLYAGLVSQLPEIKLSNIDICTKDNTDYFSYRAHGEAGRQVGVISL
jgi:YfiH family protein